MTGDHRQTAQLAPGGAFRRQLGARCRAGIGQRASRRPTLEGMRDADRTNVFEATGGACTSGAANCQHVECRYNLRDATRERNGDRRGRRLHLPIWSCALAAADDGPLSADDVARCFGVTRARIGQIEQQAIGKVRKALGKDAA